MRTISLIIAFAGIVSAQPDITNLRSDSISRSTARLGFDTSGGNTSVQYYIQYGPTAAYGLRGPAQSNISGTGLLNIGGMEPDTLYYWRVCNAAYTPPAGCSTGATLRTIAGARWQEASLPQSYFRPVYPAITNTLTVANDCSDLAAKITTAAGYDGNQSHEIRIPAGAECTGQYTLPAKTGANPNGPGYVIIRSDAADSALPPQGARVTPEFAASMPQFTAANAVAYQIRTSARGYWLMGLKFRPAANANIQAMVDVGNGGSPQYVVVDRCLFQHNGASFQRAVQLNGQNVAFANNYVEHRIIPTSTEYYNPAGNAFVINVTSGAGPFAIRNNYVRFAGMAIFVNDNNTTMPRNDIEITGNRFEMDTAQACGMAGSDGICRDVRAAFEFKRGRRVLFAGNDIGPFWSTVGTYPMILLTSRACEPGGWLGDSCGTSDFTIRDNVAHNGTGFLEVWTGDNQGYRNTTPTARVTIANNIIHDIGNAVVSNYGGYNDARGQIVANSGIEDLVMRNNTIVRQAGSAPVFLHETEQALASGGRITSNILWMPNNPIPGGNGIRYGTSLFPDGSSSSNATGTTKLAKLWSLGTAEFANNIIIGGYSGATAAEQSKWPSGNYWPGDTTAGVAAVGFRGTTGTDLCLAAGSSYAKYGAGANCDAVRASMGEVYNLRALDVSSSGATIYWTAPDAMTPCTVEYGTSMAVGTGTRVTDTPTSRFRSRSLSGLAPGTTYNYRVYCGRMAAGALRTP